MGLWSKLTNKDKRAWDATKFIGPTNDYYGRPVVGTHEASEGPPNEFTTYAERFYLGNSLVFGISQARARVFTQAEFKWRPVRQPVSPFNLFGSKGLSLLETPWTNGTTQALLSRALLDVDLCGNFYCTRELDPYTGLPRLRRLRPDWVEIVLTDLPENSLQSDVLGYAYFPGGPNWKPEYGADYFNIEDVAHWAPLPDPLAQYRGMSWIQPAVNEALLDKQTVQHKRNYFNRGAMPGIAVSFKEDFSIEDMIEFKEKFLAKHVGLRKSHDPMFLGPGADVKVIEADMKSLDLSHISAHAEERIAMAAGVPSSVAGVSEGMASSGLNQGNFVQQNYRNFVDMTITNLWQGFADAVTKLIDPPISENGNKVPVRLVADERSIKILNANRAEEAQIADSYQNMIAGYIISGFTAESAVEAVQTGDVSKLVHTGLTSVQMQPMGGPGGGLVVPPKTAEPLPEYEPTDDPKDDDEEDASPEEESDEPSDEPDEPDEPDEEDELDEDESEEDDDEDEPVKPKKGKKA